MRSTKRPSIVKLAAAWAQAEKAWEAIVGDEGNVPLATVVFQWFASQSWEGAAVNGMSREKIAAFIERIRAIATSDGNDDVSFAQLAAVIQAIAIEATQSAEPTKVEPPT